jgi:hypothetical protein
MGLGEVAQWYSTCLALGSIPRTEKEEEEEEES